MRSVVLACLALLTCSSPGWSQGGTSPVVVDDLPDGITLSSSGVANSFTRHILVFSPNRGTGGMGFGGFGGSASQVEIENSKKKQIAEVSDWQKQVSEKLVRMNLGRVEVISTSQSIPLMIAGQASRTVSFAPGSIVVHLTQKECDGEKLGSVSRQKLFESLGKEPIPFSTMLISLLDADVVKVRSEAMTKAISSGRSSAEALAKAAGVKAGKLLACKLINSFDQEESQVRLLTLSEESVRRDRTGGFYVAVNLRFGIK